MDTMMIAQRNAALGNAVFANAVFGTAVFGTAATGTAARGTASLAGWPCPAGGTARGFRGPLLLRRR